MTEEIKDKETQAEETKDQTKKDIGYKKPPKHTQFQKGESGNSKGRPKGSKNFSTVLEKELKTSISITENGKHKKVTKREAIAKQVVNKAAGGDPRHLQIALNEMRQREDQENSVAAPIGNSSEDKMIIANVVERMRRS